MTLLTSMKDLKNNKIYLTYMSQFDETAEIDLDQELSKGQRVVEMRELFSQETAQAGDAAYQRFAARFLLAKILIITVLFLLIIGVLYWGDRIRKLKTVPVERNKGLK